MGRINTVKKTYYDDTQEGFSYTFEPIESSIKVKETDEGYEARYITHDDHCDFSPSDDYDEGVFLTAYHRDFSVERKDFITKDQCVALFKNDTEDEDYPENINDKFYVFGLEAYIHSGVVLAISREGNFCDRNWDVSQIGCIFVARTECKTEKKAKELAIGLIKYWNQYLEGDVYGIVIERFNKNKELLDYDSCWGFYGYDETLAQLDDFSC